MEDSCPGDWFLEGREAAGMFCDGGFSMKDVKDGGRSSGRSSGEGLESTEDVFVKCSKAPGAVPLRIRHAALRVAEHPSCSSSNSRCHAVGVERGELEPTIYPGAK